MKNTKIRLFISTMLISLCFCFPVYAEGGNWSDESDLPTEEGYTFESSGNISYLGEKLFVLDDIKMLARGIQGNLEKIRTLQNDLQTKEQELTDTINQNTENLTKQLTVVIDGATVPSGQTSITITNDTLKTAKSITVNYRDKSAPVDPVYNTSQLADGKLIITGLVGGTIIDNIIVYH